MRILLLSDLHITENGNSIWETYTFSHFQKAFQIISSIKNIEAIVVSGDIADMGSRWAYDFVHKKLLSLGLPVYYVPGNHDSIAEMYSIIDKEHFLTPFYLNDWKFIPLNSVLPDETSPGKNMGRGYLDKYDLIQLNNELKTDKKICLILHHPPIEQDGWLNRKLLDNREDLNSIIANNKNIKLVLYGHTHYHSIKVIGHTTYICAPSVGFAFDKDLPKFQIDMGKEGFLILTINGENIDCVKCLIK